MHGQVKNPACKVLCIAAAQSTTYHSATLHVHPTITGIAVTVLGCYADLEETQSQDLDAMRMHASPTKPIVNETLQIHDARIRICLVQPAPIAKLFMADDMKKCSSKHQDTSIRRRVAFVMLHETCGHYAGLAALPAASEQQC